VFTAASEAFATANIRMTIDESLQAFEPVLAAAHRQGMWARGYVSTAFGCPYQGAVEPAAVVQVSAALAELGCDEISVGDTIGVAEPRNVTEVVSLLLEHVPADRLALHLHDTRGRAVENAAAGLALGIRTFDGATAGLGGCPFAPGAPGNLATETLVAWLHAEGLATGVDEAALAEAAIYVREELARG
jgi:hydroxymethylglutaryl-CoA lyase